MDNRSLKMVMGAGVVTAGLTAMGVAWATLDANTSWGTIPYQGEIEHNGTPINTTRDFCFRLFASPTASSALWAEAFAALPVNAGRFSVRLGTTQPLNAAVESAPDLFLQVAVADASTGGTCDTSSVGNHTVLDGLQQLGASAFAVNAKQAVPNRDFLVTGKLGIGTAAPAVALDVVGRAAVSGNASVGGTLAVAQGVSVGGDLDVSQGLRAGSATAVTGCAAGAAGGEGTQRYNYATHVMEYCNGTAWVSPADFSNTTWVDVTSMRVQGTTYTNSTNHAIQLAITFTNGSGPNGGKVFVNGAQIWFVNTGNYVGNITATPIVPPGATYLVNSAPSISAWYELR